MTRLVVVGRTFDKQDFTGEIKLTSFSKNVCSIIFIFVENATKEIQKQSVDRRKSQRKILEDLNKIRGKAEEVWDKIGKKWIQCLRKVV